MSERPFDVEDDADILIRRRPEHMRVFVEDAGPGPEIRRLEKEFVVRKDVPARLGKENVVACRVDSADLEAIDTLVEAGIRPTRSEAAAWLIRAGREAQQALLTELRATVQEIRRLRAEAQATARRHIGASPAAAPGAEAQPGTPPGA